MKLIQFKVTEHLIRQALAIPDEAEIVNIVRHEFVPGLFTFYVTHPSFPECLEGALPIEASPIATVNNENRPETWMTIDFRIPISAAEHSAHPTLLDSAPLEASSTPEYSATSQADQTPQQRG